MADDDGAIDLSTTFDDDDDGEQPQQQQRPSSPHDTKETAIELSSDSSGDDDEGMTIGAVHTSLSSDNSTMKLSRLSAYRTSFSSS